jgi:threonine aldolase
MRQIGMLAACSAYALSHHISLLPAVHQKARKLAERMHELGITIKKPVDTCMVWFDPSPVGLKCEDIAERALKLDKPITMFPADRLVVCPLRTRKRRERLINENRCIFRLRMRLLMI